ncbi:MAG: integration host factor subunit alpha [Desulfobacteraceae bacterium]|nr:integration host factor subunit alpha [Desulfobacteraceae bacterium]
MDDGGQGNITRRHLAEAINGRIGFSKELAGEIVDAFFDRIKAALLAGEEVKLVQFGVFKLREKSPRLGRNPKTGAEMEITSRSMVSFKPSRLLRDLINRDD